MSTPVLPAPLNVPIKINGYSGDAVFRSAQDFSTISRRLSKGLEIKLQIISGKERRVVQPILTFGSLSQEFEVSMIIYEDALDLLSESGLNFTSLEGKDAHSDCLYEVIIGKELIEQIGIDMTDFSKEELTGSFGTVCLGTMQKFVIKDYTNTDYSKDKDDRIILFFDMDCFLLQLHEEDFQKGQPRVVISSSGRILAASVEAKKLGINKISTPYILEASEVCSELISIEITKTLEDERIEKILPAIQTTLKNYGSTTVEYSSNDGIYIDITGLVSQIEKSKDKSLIQEIKNVKVWQTTLLYNGSVNDKPTPEYVHRRFETFRRKPSLSVAAKQEIRLIYGATIANLAMEEILNQTGLKSSVGIGSNKLVSKIASILHKPGCTTILAPTGFNNFSKIVQIGQVPWIGGKIGQAIREQCSIFTIAELQLVNVKKLSSCFVDQGSNRSPRRLGPDEAKLILNSAHGISDEPVVCHKSLEACCVNRQLYGESYTLEEMQTILTESIEEVLENLQFEERTYSKIPTKITLTIYLQNEDNVNLEMDLDETNEFVNHYEMLYDRLFDSLSCWNDALLVEAMGININFS